jgi:molecular chaperone GrpE
LSTEKKDQSTAAAETSSVGAEAAKPGEATKNEKNGAEGLFAAARQRIRQDAGAAAETESPSAVSSEALVAELTALKSELAETRERHLRTLAEMENLRRRTDREKSDASKFAITRFARDMLTVADNFDRALGTVTPEAAEKDPALKAFLEGVQLTQRELLNVLERHGVRKVEADGQRFDPHLHQAMMEMENKDVPAGTVIKSFQPAFVIEDRILRPAMVVVSKGGPKAAPKPANDQPAAPAENQGPTAELDGEAGPGEEVQTKTGSE